MFPNVLIQILKNTNQCVKAPIVCVQVIIQLQSVIFIKNDHLQTFGGSDNFQNYFGNCKSHTIMAYSELKGILSWI